VSPKRCSRLPMRLCGKPRQGVRSVSKDDLALDDRSAHQCSIIQFSDEHRGRHEHLGPDTDPDAELLLLVILAVTVILDVGAPVRLVALVLHVL
jgi:hypothetical protein